MQQMLEEQQSQSGPAPVHTPLLAHQLHSPQNCESSQNTSRDP